MLPPQCFIFLLTTLRQKEEELINLAYYTRVKYIHYLRPDKAKFRNLGLESISSVVQKNYLKLKFYFFNFNFF